MAKLIFSIQATLLDTRWSKLRIDLTTTLHNTNKATIMCSCVEIENDIINVSAPLAMRFPQIPHMAGMLTWQSGWPPTWRQRGEDHGSGKLSASGVSPVPAERWKQKSQWERFECFTLISMILIVRQLMRRALSPWTAWSWSWGSSRGGWQRSWRPPSPPPSPHTKLPPTSLWHHY